MSLQAVNKKKSISELQESKKLGKKISMLTCYDYTFAQILNTTDIDIILVGDSGVMTQLGYPDTTHATIEMMCVMTQAVAFGAPDKFIVADMPFLSQRHGIQHALSCADQLIKSGANAIKIEGIEGHENVIQHLTQSGIPVMGHLGLTPQSVHSVGYQVQGKNEAAAKLIKSQSLELEKLGCFGLVLECIPSALSKEICTQLSIPVIGIGAGIETDGQVLVLQDMLGMTQNLKPKFVRHFMEARLDIFHAINQFHQAVIEQSYPTPLESYNIKIN